MNVFFLNHFLHINTSFILTLFFVNTVGLFYCFYKAWKVDPGLIHITETEQYKVSHWEVVLVRENCLPSLLGISRVVSNLREKQNVGKKKKRLYARKSNDTRVFRVPRASAPLCHVSCHCSLPNEKGNFRRVHKRYLRTKESYYY